MKIRQGKDIVLRWKVLTNGQDVSLGGRNITLVMTTPLGREKIVEHEVEGSVVKAHLLGKTLMHLGDYTLTLWENRGEEGQTAVDAVNAFTLVQYSTQEDNGSPCGNLEYEVAELATANMDVITSNEVVIESVEVVDNLESDATDKALSARQGKELKGMIPTKVSELENDEGYITEIPEGYATKEDVGEAVSTVQKKQLQLSVKDNGNIVLSNESGESKEFMPATPSGDPMHWAYIALPFVTYDTDTNTYSVSGYKGLTSDDMRQVYREKDGIYQCNILRRFYSSRAKVLLPVVGWLSNLPSLTGSIFASNSYIECVKWANNYGLDSRPTADYAMPCSSLSGAFYGCTSLHTIYLIDATRLTSSSHFAYAFYGCVALVELRLGPLKAPLSLSDSPSISKSSVKYMIDNATPTSAITITLHPDAYARLAEDADIVAALEAQPLVTFVSA